MRLVRSPDRPSVREIYRHTWTVELPSAWLDIISVGFGTLESNCTMSESINQYHISLVYKSIRCIVIWYSFNQSSSC